LPLFQLELHNGCKIIQLAAFPNTIYFD